MTDILGPASALNAVAARPSDGRNYGPVDTFFKDCSSPSTQDGTQVSAAWLNQVTGVLRALARANGLKQDGVTPVVPYDQSDNMPLNAVLQLVQRGQLNFAIDKGTSDQMLATPAAAVAEYLLGMRFLVLKNPAVGTNATPTPTINFGLGNLTVVKSDGSPIGAGDLRKGGIFEVELDGAGNARLTSLVVPSDVRINLKVTLTLFIRPDGSDANTGSADNPGNAFRTIGGAFLACATRYNLGGYAIQLQLSTTYAAQVLGSAQPVSYAGCFFANLGLVGAVTLNGDPAAQANYIVTPIQMPDGTFCCVASGMQAVGVQGVTVDGSSVGAGSCLRATSGGQLTYGNVVLRYSNASGSFNMVASDPGGITSRNGPVRVTGGGTVNSVIQAVEKGADTGCSVAPAQTVTVDNLTFNQFYSVPGGSASLQNTAFSVGANVSGARYALSDGGKLYLAGQAEAAIPGTIPGTSILNSIVDGAAGADWTTFTPGISSNGTMSASATGRYRKNSRTVDCVIQCSISQAGNSTGAFFLGFPLPASIATAGAGVETLTGKGVRFAISGTSGSVALADGTTAITNGAQIYIAFRYETTY